MRTTTRELSSETWTEYFDALGRELLHAPTSIEEDVFEVAVARNGPHQPCVLRHLVDRPARVAVDNNTMLAPMTIAVDGHDGIRTTIRIEDDP